MSNACHICGNESEYECRDCERLVCDKCTMPYNQFTQIDYTLCKVCGGIQDEQRIGEIESEIEAEKKKEQKRKDENEKRRLYYHSEPAKEKRRIKKEEDRERKRQADQERQKRMASIMADIFRHLR